VNGKPLSGTSQAEQAVLEAAATCVAAFGSHDTPGYFACFAPTATFLFHQTDRLLGSREEYEAEWASWESDGFRVLSCASSEQRVDVLGDGTVGTVAVFTHRVLTTVRAAADEAPQGQRERETIVFRRQADGRWLGVHEHLSPEPG